MNENFNKGDEVKVFIFAFCFCIIIAILLGYIFVKTLLNLLSVWGIISENPAFDVGMGNDVGMLLFALLAVLTFLTGFLIGACLIVKLGLKKEKFTFKTLRIPLIIFLSLVFIMFIASGIIIWDQGKWRVSMIIFMFMLPFFFLLLLPLIRGKSIKRDKGNGESNRTSYLIFELIVIVFGCVMFPIEDFFKTQFGFVFLLAWIPLFVLGTYGLIKDIVESSIYKKIYTNPLSKRVKAVFVKGVRFRTTTIRGQVSFNGYFSSSSSSKTKLYERSTFKIKFMFYNEKGDSVFVTTNKSYTYDEVLYLKYKQTFDILALKNRAVIVEDLNNIEIPKEEIPVLSKNLYSSTLPQVLIDEDSHSHWGKIITIGYMVFVAFFAIFGPFIFNPQLENLVFPIMCIAQFILSILFIFLKALIGSGMDKKFLSIEYGDFTNYHDL